MERQATSLNYNNNNSSRSAASTPSAEFPILSLDPNTNTSPNQNQSPAQEPMIRYKECQRNHAAHMGQHVLDGCGEFMPAGEEGTPLSLKCAACECHRNFHRRERNGGTDPTAITPTTPTFPPMLPAPPPPPQALPPPPASTANCYISFNTTTPNGNNNNNKAQKSQPIRAQHQQQHHVSPGFQSRAPVMMTFGGAAAESSSEDLHVEQYGSSKKRFRTKFSSEQKDKMLQFADKIGWKIQRQDDSEVQRFCDEVGVKRQVFKVWLHNNKQAIKRTKQENE